MRQRGQRISPHREKAKMGRREEGEHCAFFEELQFLSFDLDVRFLLGLFAFCDLFAEATGMLAVKGFSNRIAERGILGVGHNHANPCHRLQHCPMQADGAGQSQSDYQLCQPEEHRWRIASGRFVSNDVDTAMMLIPQTLLRAAGQRSAVLA